MTPAQPSRRHKVVGIGGGGRQRRQPDDRTGTQGRREFIAINTDARVLLMSDADVKTRRRGVSPPAAPAPARDSGGRPQGGRGRQGRDRGVAARRDMVFVTAGEGGGTGTGRRPAVANIARKLGALTVGVATRPPSFEGAPRRPG